MTKRVFLLIVSLLTIGISFAQKSQKIAYIDMEYILENVPEYQEANQQLEIKVKRWQNKIAKQQKEIELLKTNLDNERALLTNNLIKEREEDIDIRVEELTKTQDMYFGVNGDLYRLRKQLVKPVQDQIYNAIQEIAKKSKYDFVLDKSTDLIMLYTNSRYDISDKVVSSIVRTEKKEELKSKREKKQQEIEEKQKAKKEANPEVANKLEEREAKRKELQERIAAQKAERLKKREDKLKAIEEARQKKIEERQAARNQPKAENTNTPENNEEEKTQKNNNEQGEEEIEKKKIEVTKETSIENEIIEEVETTKDTSVEEEKAVEEKTPVKTEQEKLREKIEAQKAERLKQKEERLKEIEEARKKRLKEREEAKKKQAEERAARLGINNDSIPPAQEPENNNPE